MLLPKFEFYEPATLEEACRLLALEGERAKLLAGGTDLIVNMKKKILAPGHLISLSRIKELKRLAFSDGVLRIGACITASELSESEEIRRRFNALANGAGGLGSPLIRNLATLGGNLISARPAADLPPSLMAYGARVTLKKGSGERSVPVEDLFLGPGKTLIAPDEILTEIVLDGPPPHTGAAYLKLGVRKALEISMVNVAASISLNSPDGAISKARIVLGSVGPTPLRAPSAEKALIGERPSEALFTRAGEAASKDSRPIDDFRASAEYQRDMVAVLTSRALGMALTKAKEKG